MIIKNIKLISLVSSVHKIYLYSYVKYVASPDTVTSVLFNCKRGDVNPYMWTIRNASFKFYQ